MESTLKKYLGKKVKITVDRPLSSKHPDFGWKYPLNYGYLPGIKSKDGEKVDAFILGVKKPIKEFEGRVIAIVHRLDDKEEKLVVAPEGKNFSKKEIKKLLHFQEKFFKSKIIK
jgi:inorganic pyrophosphatase